MNSQYENFPKPPIQEALLDFRVGFVNPPTQDDIKKLVPILARNYPVSNDVFRYNAPIAFGEGVGTTNQISNFGGLRFESTERNFVFQAHVDGFTISKLKPYRNWDELVNEAKELWKDYFGVLKPQTIERIACRYINRIEVNEKVFDFNDYLTAAPHVPEKLPQGVSRYLTQMEIPAPQEGATVIITQSLEGISDAPPAFLLDIDVFKVESFTAEESLWWVQLEKLRTLKNQFFFENVTDKAKALFR
jgi:uncharacterized protein (TIGR04255 family)